MLDTIISFLEQFPRGLATILMATLPVTELRLAIPVAVNIWLVPPLTALGLALIGNFLPFFPLYFGLDFIRSLSERHTPWATRLIDAFIDRSRSKIEKKYAKYGALALLLFTALPLPITGLWTATVAAVALKIPFKHALAGISGGIFLAGIIVTVLSVSGEVFF